MPLLSLLPSSWAKSFPIFSAFSPKWCKGRGNRGCSQFSSSNLCYFFILAFFRCFSMGFLPLGTVLHKFVQGGSFPQAAVPHELLQHGCLPECMEKALFQDLEHFLPPLTRGSTGLFLSHLSLSPIRLHLKVVSQRCHRHDRWAWPWPALGPSCSWLGLNLLDTGDASCSFSQKPRYSIPAVKSIATQTQHSCEKQMCSGKYNFGCSCQDSSWADPKTCDDVIDLLQSALWDSL